MKLQPYWQHSVSGKGNQKLNSKFHGPFEIIKKVGEVAYQLRLPEGSSIYPIFHVSQLKAHIGQCQLVVSNLPLIGTNKEVLVTPQSILARMMIKRDNATKTQVFGSLGRARIR